MKIDPYQPCPGGKPEKVKFCCRDLITEHGRIAELRDANQPHACAQYLDGLLAKYPDRTCLRVLRAHEWLCRSNVPAAGEIIEPLINEQPNNMLVRLYSAPHAAVREGPTEGLVRLYGAVAATPSLSPVALLVASYRLLEVLDEKDLPMAASHLAYVVIDIAGDQGPQLPLLVKFSHDPSMLWHVAIRPRARDPYPEGDEPWADSYRATQRSRYDLDILKERSELEALVAAHPTAQQAWYRLGCVRGILADHAGAVEALRKAAALEGSLDLAVLAESIAQLLEPNSALLVRMPCLAWKVSEPELLKSHLRTHPCCRAIPDEQRPEEDFYCFLADRPLSSLDRTWADGDLPEILAYLQLLKRSEHGTPVLVARAASVPAAASFPQCIHDLLGTAPGGQSWLGAPVELPEESATVEPEFMPVVIVPPTIDAARMREAERRTVLHWVEKWQNQPSPHLEGQTPAQAASDPRLRIKLAALLLNWEAATATENIYADELFALVRERLGVPRPAPPVADADAPFLLLCHAPINLQENPAVVGFFTFADQSGHLVALRRLVDALENSERDELLTCLYADSCAILANSASVPDEQLYWLQRARRVLEAVNGDLFQIDLRRIQLLSSMKRWEEALDSTRQAEAHVRSQRPSDLRQRLAVLQEIAQRLEQAKEHDQSVAASQQIWTPEAEAAPTKSTLWLPGQD